MGSMKNEYWMYRIKKKTALTRHKISTEETKTQHNKTKHYKNKYVTRDWLIYADST